MKTTSENRTTTKKGNSPFRRFFVNVFGGEFLAKKTMRPWYFYFIFVLVLVALLVVSEQRIRMKQKKINDLENVYKAEISKLKANNQFIPYEKNKILINKMQEKGFITDEKHIFTVEKSVKKEEKQRWFRRKEGKREKR